MPNDAIHKINKHAGIGNQLKGYRKQTGNMNPYPL